VGAALLFFNGGGGSPSSGTTLWPWPVSVPFDLEVIRQPDNQSLFRFISQPVVTPTAGQPWYLWPKPVLPPEPDAVQPPIDLQALLRYRTGYQTVGQSYRLWQRYQPPTIDEAPIGPVDSQGLYRFRTSYQTVGQPWTTWPLYRAPGFEPEVIVGLSQQSLFNFIRSQVTQPPGQPWYVFLKPTLPPEPDPVVPPIDLQALHRYRTGYQTVGQPFWTLQRPIPLLPEEQFFAYVDDQALFRFRGKVFVAIPGQPYWIWPRIIGSPEPEVPFRDPNSYALFAFREIYPPPPPVVTQLPLIGLGLSLMRLGGTVT
jgi:hypothetical protein